jgi:hypothetical protein
MTNQKRYRAFKFEETNVNGEVFAQFTMYREDLIRNTEYSDVFDTEEEAIAFCYKTNQYAKWVIIPEIRFID